MDDFDLRDLLSPPLRYQSDLPPKPQCPPPMGGAGQVLAMAYVPPQEWDALYPAEQALLRGTLFAQLDYPFEGGAPQ
jgi:hypothetical protein